MYRFLDFHQVPIPIYVHASKYELEYIHLWIFNHKRQLTSSSVEDSTDSAPKPTLLLKTHTADTQMHSAKWSAGYGCLRVLKKDRAEPKQTHFSNRYQEVINEIIY